MMKSGFLHILYVLQYKFDHMNIVYTLSTLIEVLSEVGTLFRHKYSNI